MPNKQSDTKTTVSFGKKTKTLDELFEAALKDIYSAEKQLVEALPKMAEAADNEELQDAFNKHLHETQRHVQRIEKICERLQLEPEGETCAAMEGLIKEGQKIIDEFERSPVRDSAMIIGAQKIEHYEIASYGSLCELADVLGHGRIHELLGRTLDEEENTDHDLSILAQDINDEAHELSQQESSGEEEDDDEDNNNSSGY